MSKVIGVRLTRSGRVYYFDPGELDVTTSELVVVEGELGIETAEVVIASDQVVYSELREPLKPVLRKATLEDLQP